jgi:quercetin dioxygenase-like cupin family protein
MFFPEAITRLPQADLPFAGAQAFISQAETHQVLFMEFAQDVELPEHTHAAQAGFVLAGRIDLTIGNEKHTYLAGERYFIPAGVEHGGRIYAGYADITFFDEPNRYKPR